MRGLMPEPDISYTNFAAELDIDPSYLRRVLKRLSIEGHQDPTNKSRKLLTADQQRRTRDTLKRDNTGTPGQNTGTPGQNTGTSEVYTEVYTGELVLHDINPMPADHSIALHQQNDREGVAVGAALARQLAGFDRNLDVLCSSIQANVHQRVSRAVANGISSGLSQGNAQVDHVRQ
jgi:hypothetical protein